MTVARVFDAHPYLRPRRVGGDPARIKVEPSMESVVKNQGLPIEWLTVRRNEPSGAFEGGEIDLLPGRGGWMGTEEDGEWTYSLIGHTLEQTWLADTMAEPGAVEAVADLFEELVTATDAAYGCVLPWAGWTSPLDTFATAKLPGVYWLNYFGPAFIRAHPELAAATGARLLDTGGVLIRTTDEPRQPYEDGTPAWQAEIRTIFGDEAFEWACPNPALPSVEEHLAASPGTMDMPWVAWLSQKADNTRVKKHTAALERLERARSVRDEPVMTRGCDEWSTSLDLVDWPGFARHLTRTLRGDLSTALGRATIAVIDTAPLDHEGSVLLHTELGTIRLGWLMDDEYTVDIYIWGHPEVSGLCQAWFN